MADDRDPDPPLSGVTDHAVAWEGSPIDDLPRGTSVAGHMILGRIGASESGVVYAAFDPQLDRKIALKLISVNELDPELADKAKEALVRQAHAASQVAHECVIKVHDVGEFDGGIYIAMEFVDGIDLRQWMEARDDPFPWPEVLRVFREAGRGLAAAHSAGVVHRDFKPGNVLLGKQGRICVLDFGVAGAVDDDDDDDDGMGGSELREQLAQLTGHSSEREPAAILGTPAYMAPEQHAAGGSDAKTDQFAFCVAFYEALYGERPFKGTRRMTLALEALNNRVREPPAEADVPQWLREVLLRGLKAKRNERFPSMEALLRPLEHDPAARRKRWGLGVAALLTLTAGVAGVLYMADLEEERCEPDATLMSGVWDPATRQTLHDAFARTGKAHAQDTWKATEDLLDAWVGQWFHMRKMACTATRERQDASESLLARRNACLNAHLIAFSATVEVFSDPEMSFMDRAPFVVAQLGHPSACASEAALVATAPAPDFVRKRATEVRVLAGQVRTLVRAGATDRAREVHRTLQTRLQDVGSPPLKLDARLLEAVLTRASGDTAGSNALLHQLAADAAAQGQPHFMAHAWLELARTSTPSSSAAEHEIWTLYAQVLAEPLREDQILVDIPLAHARFSQAHGRNADALSAYHQALDAADSDPISAELTRATILVELGALVAAGGEWASAQQHLDRALHILRHRLGPDHPALIGPLQELANIYVARGESGEASAQLERALGLSLATYGERAAITAQLHVELGMLKLDNEARSAAEHFEAAVATFDASRAEHHDALVDALLRLGKAKNAMGQAASATRPLRRAVDLHKQRTPDARSRDRIAEVQEALGRALWDQPGSRAEAMKLLQEARHAFARQDPIARDAIARIDAWVGP